MLHTRSVLPGWWSVMTFSLSCLWRCKAALVGAYAFAPEQITYPDGIIRSVEENQGKLAWGDCGSHRPFL